MIAVRGTDVEQGLTPGRDDDDVDVVLGERRARRTVRTSELKVHRDGPRVQCLNRQELVDASAP
jgi:hypothetical protein